MWVCHVCWNEGMQLFKCKSQSTSSHFTQIQIKKPLCHAFLSTRNWIEFSQFNYTWRTLFFWIFCLQKVWNNAYKKTFSWRKQLLWKEKWNRSFLEISPMKTKVKHSNWIFKRIHSFVRSNIIVNFFFVRSNEKFQFIHINRNEIFNINNTFILFINEKEMICVNPYKCCIIPHWWHLIRFIEESG